MFKGQVYHQDKHTDTKRVHYTKLSFEVSRNFESMSVEVISRQVEWLELLRRVLSYYLHELSISHMLYEMAQFYLQSDRGDVPAVTAVEAGTRLIDHRRMRGWVDLSALMAITGFESATRDPSNCESSTLYHCAAVHPNLGPDWLLDSKISVTVLSFIHLFWTTLQNKSAVLFGLALPDVLQIVMKSLMASPVLQNLSEDCW